MPDVKLVAIQDSDAGLVARRAAEVGSPPTFTDYRQNASDYSPRLRRGAQAAPADAQDRARPAGSGLSVSDGEADGDPGAAQDRSTCTKLTIARLNSPAIENFRPARRLARTSRALPGCGEKLRRQSRLARADGAALRAGQRSRAAWHSSVKSWSGVVMVRQAPTGTQNMRARISSVNSRTLRPHLASRTLAGRGIDAMNSRTPRRQPPVQCAGSTRQAFGPPLLLQAYWCRRRHQPRRPPLAKIRPGRPAPAMGPGTADGRRSGKLEIKKKLCTGLWSAITMTEA